MVSATTEILSRAEARKGVVYIDIETDSVDTMKAIPFLFQLGRKIPDSKSSDLIVDVYNLEKNPKLNIDKLIEGKIVVGHNLSYDLFILKRVGLINKYPDKIWDTMVVYKNLFNLTSVLKLKELGKTLFGIENTKELMIKQWLQNHKGATYKSIPLDIMIPYAIEDIRLVSLLYNYEKNEIEKRNRILSGGIPLNGYIERDNDVILTTLRMKEHGVKIDLELTKMMLDKILIDITVEQENIKNFFGNINPRSTVEIIKYCNEHNIEINTWTDKGNPRLDNNTLLNIGGTHPEFIYIDAYRKYDRIATLLQSFLDKEIEGYIHADFNIGFSDTGRITSSNPNLQNVSKKIKIRNKVIDMRNIFIPEKDFKFFFIDYSQAELRLFSNYANCTKMNSAFNSNQDLHKLTASIIFNKNEISKEEREIGKTINFGILYGMGYKTFANNINISEEKAKYLLNLFYKGYPELLIIRNKLVSLIKKRVGILSEKGFIRNASGRLLFIEHEYRALTFLIQSTCADIIKQKMIDIETFLLPYKSKLIMTIHDELGIHLHKDEEFLIPKIKKIMENPTFNLNSIPTDMEIYSDRWRSK